MKNDMDHNRALLGSIGSSMGELMTGFGDVKFKMSEALTKLDAVQKSMPMALGYCWDRDSPILLLDGLGRKTSLPMMLAGYPDVRV